MAPVKRWPGVDLLCRRLFSSALPAVAAQVQTKGTVHHRGESNRWFTKVESNFREIGTVGLSFISTHTQDSSISLRMAV